VVSRETDSPDGVSRETPDPGPPPSALTERYPAAMDVLRRYTDLLATDGVERGLIGPREVPRLWERHLLNCAVVEELVPADATLADVGSGSGLPGLVLAAVRPDVSVTLIEPLLRRATFLGEAVETLGLPNVEVVRSRAEDLADRRFTVVTARAVAPLRRLAGWCAPLIEPDGWMLALKGDRAATELAETTSVLGTLGLLDARIVEVGPVDGPMTITVVMRKDARQHPAGATAGKQAGKQKPKKRGGRRP
jgi:16S rRNA (guanine527-N7)-methyltransferase